MTGAGRSPGSPAATPPLKLSVVVPTFNRRRRLVALLQGLAEQELPRSAFEVIVVSDGSIDGTDEYLHSDDLPLPVRAATQANLGPAAARNAGIEIARADVVLFLDDDVVPAPDLLARHLAAHETSPTPTVVIGPMRTPALWPMRGWVHYEQAMLHKQYDAMETGAWEATCRQFYTGNASVPRRVLVELGGFDTGFTRSEDVELGYRLERAGMAFRYEATAAVEHFADRTFDSWLRTARAYGRIDVVLGRDRQHPTLELLVAEFPGRHACNRMLALWVATGRRRSHVAMLMLRALAFLIGRTAGSSVTRPLYSAMFNLAYFAGVDEELGPSLSLRRLLRRPPAPFAAPLEPCATVVPASAEVGPRAASPGEVPGTTEATG